MINTTKLLYHCRITRETGLLYSFYVQMVCFELLKRETGENEPAASILNLPDLSFPGGFLQKLPSSYSNQKIFPEFIPY